MALSEKEMFEKAVSLANTAESLYPSIAKIGSTILIRRIKCLLIALKISNEDWKLYKLLKNSVRKTELLDKIFFTLFSHKKYFDK